MSKYWMLVLALVVFTCGCNAKSKDQIKTEMDDQNAKVAESLKNAPKGDGPGFSGGPPKDDPAPVTKEPKAKDDAPSGGAPVEKEDGAEK